MILSLGESLMDMVSGSDGVYRGAPGGSPYNVALALGRLGAPVRFLGRFSRDQMGRELRAHLEESGVDLSLSLDCDELTTLGFAFIGEASGRADYTFYLDGTAGCSLSREDVAGVSAEDVSALHVSSFSLFVRPVAETIDTLLDRLGETTVVSVDPNIRTFLIQDDIAVRARIEGVMARADMVKLSDEDLDWLGEGVTVAEYCQRWIERGVTLMVVTLGEKGVYGAMKGCYTTVRAPEIHVADTIGAGDTLQAGLLAWLDGRGFLSKKKLTTLGESELREALAFAAGTAAVTCSRQGCDPPRREELDL